MYELIEVFDIVFAVILIFVFRWQSSSSKNIPAKHSKYYSNGLTVKMLGAFLFCFIYGFYYQGGDTVNYFYGVKALYNVFWKSPMDYFRLLFQENDWKTWSLLYSFGETMPKYMFRDDRTFLVVRLTSVLSLFTFGGFFSTSILLAKVVYRWNWRLFEFISSRYENIEKMAFWGVLALPSIVFWGSGIMKDTFTLSATCFFLSGLNSVFLQRKNAVRNGIQLVIAFWLILTIKSYILFALLQGALIYFNFERLKNIKSSLVKFIVLPIILIGSIFLLQTIFLDMDELFGKYSADRLLEEAITQQEDLKRSVYGDNSFDIGTVEPTISGALSKAPVAINAALYRPYLWEVGSPIMIFSALENTFLLFYTLWLIFKGGLVFFRTVFSDGFLVFSVLFILFLSFGIGFSTSNFGALVRYKIPLLPFYFLLFAIVSDKKVKLISS